MASEEMDKDTVEKLRKSKEIVGYLGEVIKDQEGSILSGRHRKLADPEWPEKQVTVTDPLQRELLILHYNVQRTVSKEETQRRLLNVAKLVESTGVPQDEVCSQVANLVPYTPQYVRELLPDEYKMLKHAPKTEPKLVSVVSEDTRKPTDWVRCEGESCNILTRATPGHMHEGKVLCSRCYAKAVGKPEAPQKPVRTFDVSEEREIPESEPEPKWRTTITMKKPYTEDWPIKPDEDMVFEAFSDAVKSGSIDKLFKITIKEIE